MKQILEHISDPASPMGPGGRGAYKVALKPRQMGGRNKNKAPLEATGEGGWGGNKSKVSIQLHTSSARLFECLRRCGGLSRCLPLCVPWQKLLCPQNYRPAWLGHKAEERSDMSRWRNLNRLDGFVARNGGEGFFLFFKELNEQTRRGYGLTYFWWKEHF